MNNKIPSINSSENKDRAGLNVGNHTKKNKNMIIGIFILVALIVIGVAVFFAFSPFSETESEEEVPTVTQVNHTAGSEKSALNEGDNYFARLRQEKERKAKLELARKTREQKQAEESLKEANEKPPVEVKRTKDKPTEPVQPRPVVVRQQPKSNTNSGSRKDAPITPKDRKRTKQVTIDFGTSSNQQALNQASYDDSFNASTFAPGKARLRKPGELDFMLIHGTAIPCSLYTQIISDYSGFVTCRVIQDVYSANGAALLVEKGSLISGTQNVEMELGKARIFTAWADIETPHGVSIRIDSLGTGALGASGHEAWVDNHFQERFGGAILLSFVDDALGALSSEIGNNTSVQLDNSTENASDMASKALESSINIAPTGYSHIGQRINILIARDIDMSSIYQFGE